MNRWRDDQEQLVSRLQDRILELLEINEDHKKLNGILREDLRSVLRVFDTIDFNDSHTCSHTFVKLYDKIPWEVLESYRS